VIDRYDFAVRVRVRVRDGRPVARLAPNRAQNP
jgi:hypothetical protein